MDVVSAASPLDIPAAELSVVDVYDIAAVFGQEFERTIDRFGCDVLTGVIPKVVRVLELLEVVVSRAAAGKDAERLRSELEQLQRERSDRQEQEKKHQEELEQVEDVWRGEVQDLLSQISQLQADKKKLLVSLSLSQAPITEEDLQRQQGMSEKEKQVMKRLKDLVDKQRDEIRAKDRELSQRNKDVEALQMQQSRLTRINQDLRHRIGAMEVQGKVLIQQRAEMEAEAQARQQEVAALQQQVVRLREELQELEMEREVSEIEETSRAGNSSSRTPKMKLKTKAMSGANKQESVWEECGGDPGFMAKCFEGDGSPSFTSTRIDDAEEEDGNTMSLLQVSTDLESDEEADSLEQESDSPRFTLQELRDVLQERNELKSQLFLLQEELTYYKSEECEEDFNLTGVAPSPSPAPSEPTESGIKRLIFTAIMPMVAAGLLADDPTLLPIRRLISLV
ncbi:RILP-like protein 1 isoform X1 [Synchiropus splendidus]|uniref:RILP-like protein 1 isoform X1 n=1 Tax=Synchiropus splendidus TaxID=270530 RepID=UPI00237E87C2|nr:RILP-like protein 1 isoform X1 [Synchiropus splendidus]